MAEYRRKKCFRLNNLVDRHMKMNNLCWQMGCKRVFDAIDMYVLLECFYFFLERMIFIRIKTLFISVVFVKFIQNNIWYFIIFVLETIQKVLIIKCRCSFCKFCVNVCTVLLLINMYAVNMAVVWLPVTRSLGFLLITPTPKEYSHHVSDKFQYLGFA